MNDPAHPTYPDDADDAVGLPPAADDGAELTAEEADRILARISEHEARALAIATQRQAIDRNLEIQENAQRRAADRLRHVYATPLRRLAERKLAGHKVQTLRLTWGSLALRTTRPKWRVTDMEAAVRYFEAVDPALVVVTSRVTDTAADRHLSALPPGKAVAWAERTEETTSLLVQTGIPARPPTPPSSDGTSPSGTGDEPPSAPSGPARSSTAAPSSSPA